MKVVFTADYIASSSGTFITSLKYLAKHLNKYINLHFFSINGWVEDN